MKKIRSPKEALLKLLGDISQPIVFVDDFVGSGEQFLETWKRTFSFSSSVSSSFQEFSSRCDGQFYYCPVLCTEYGYNRLHTQCPQVTLSPAHILPTQYSALAPNSAIWPPDLRSSAIDFLRGASLRAGIPESGGTDDWRGFHQLGLALAFESSIPDATMPIFYWEKNGWKPLVRRA